MRKYCQRFMVLFVLLAVASGAGAGTLIGRSVTNLTDNALTSTNNGTNLPTAGIASSEATGVSKCTTGNRGCNNGRGIEVPTRVGRGSHVAAG